MALETVSTAVRALSRSPGLAVTIVLTLGLGVGANAAVFTALDRLFFQPPAGVADPGSIRRIYARNFSKQLSYYGPGGRVTPMVETRDFRDLGQALRGMAQVVAEYRYPRGKLSPSGQPVVVSFVSPDYFEFIGLRPDYGRFFNLDEGQLAASAPVAVLNERFWRSQYGSDPGILGKTLRVDETIYTIIGVAPRVFDGVELGGVDLWAPLPNIPGGLDRASTLRLLARLRPGVDSRTIDQRLTAQYRATHLGDPYVEEQSEVISAPILEARGPVIGERGRIPGVSERSLALLPRLAGLSLVVLVVAIANAASLLLMRAVQRQREIAVRLALGISRRRLVGQLVVESTVLAVVAGAVALLFAAGAGRVLRSQLASLLRWPDAVVDQRVVWLAMLLAIAAGVAAGLVPAAFALRADVGALLKASSTAGSRHGARIRSALLVTQAALCMALLAAGAVFLQSLRRAGRFDRGFDADRTVLVSMPAYHPAAAVEFDRVIEQVGALPGVEAAGRSLTGLSAIGFSATVGTSAADTVGEGPQGPAIEFVGPDLLRAAGLRALTGRLLTAADRSEPVALVNRALAAALWRSGRPGGSCIYVRGPVRPAPCRSVVGVVEDFRWDVAESPIYRVYLPVEQVWNQPDPSFVPSYLVVRMTATATGADLARLRRAIGPILTGGDADLTIARVASLLEPQLRPWRLAATLFLVLGALGLAAAVAGIYGLVAFDVAQRSRELGLRIALGAPPAAIVRLVVTSGLRVTLIGVAAGTVAALVAGRAMASLLFATSPYDPVALAATATLLLSVALVASLLPARRALRLDPVVVLASE